MPVRLSGGGTASAAASSSKQAAISAAAAGGGAARPRSSGATSSSRRASGFAGGALARAPKEGRVKFRPSAAGGGARARPPAPPRRGANLCACIGAIRLPGRVRRLGRRLCVVGPPSVRLESHSQILLSPPRHGRVSAPARAPLSLHHLLRWLDLTRYRSSNHARRYRAPLRAVGAPSCKHHAVSGGGLGPPPGSARAARSLPRVQRLQHDLGRHRVVAREAEREEDCLGNVAHRNRALPARTLLRRAVRAALLATHVAIFISVVFGE